MSISWIEQCKRDRAWNAAIEDLLSDSPSQDIESKDVRWKKCVYFKEYGGMDDTCWAAIITAYNPDVSGITE